jgi:peptide/nickel transport system ATP-binding protein
VSGGVERPLLEVTDLVTHFKTDRGIVQAVNGVSFTLAKGQTLGVVGESGSGKSVLSRSIMNLLPRRGVIRKGQVVFDGQETTSMSAKQSRKLYGPGMAMIFQDPMTSLNPVVKIGRQLTEGLTEHFDIKKDAAMETAEELLRSVGIPEPKRRLSEYPFQLSGGMRQRVVIASALACGPQLLFADEPTTALDVTVQKTILNLLARQQRERDMSMILVTHDLGVVAGRTDEIMVMYAGMVVEKASTMSLFTQMRHPYTEALLKSIPKVSDPSHTRLESIPGRPPNLITPPTGCRFAPRCTYADDWCHKELPPLTEDAESPGHFYRCWNPVSVNAVAITEKPIAVAVTVPTSTSAGVL